MKLKRKVLKIDFAFSYNRTSDKRTFPFHILSQMDGEARQPLSLSNDDLQFLVETLGCKHGRLSRDVRKKAIGILKDGVTRGGGRDLQVDWDNLFKEKSRKIATPLPPSQRQAERPASQDSSRTAANLPDNLPWPAPSLGSAGRLIIVGCGEIADLYVNCLCRSSGCFIECVIDLDIGRAESLAATATQLQEAMYGPTTKVCAHSTIQAAVAALAPTQRRIAVNLTPTSTHFKMNRTLLLLGLDVWSEKPVAETTAEARTLFDIAQSNGLQLGCAPLSCFGESQHALYTLLTQPDKELTGPLFAAFGNVYCGAWETPEFRTGG
jgi:hypothetical protein